MRDPIYVTRPYLPHLAEFMPSLEKIWESRVLTNNGPIHRELKARLQDLPEAHYLSLTTNGMLALSGAIEAADIEWASGR